MIENQDLSVKELFEKVYNSFKQNCIKEIKLPSEVRAEIADDSDYHRTNVGYICYDKAVIINNDVAIAMGYTSNNYPADEFECDLVVIDISDREKQSNEDLLFEIIFYLEKNTYFHSSIIYARSNGQIGANSTSENPRKLIKLITPKYDEYVSKKMETDQSVYSARSMFPVVRSPILYKPEFANFIYNKICQVVGLKYEKIGLLVLSDDQTKFLACRKAKNDVTDNWIMPGGQFHEESVEKCLINEIKEELSCEVDFESLQFVSDYSDVAAGAKGKIVEIHLYHGKLIGEPKPSSEIKMIGWLGKEDVNNEDVSPIIRKQILPDLIKRQILK